MPGQAVRLQDRQQAASGFTGGDAEKVTRFLQKRECFDNIGKQRLVQIGPGAQFGKAFLIGRHQALDGRRVSAFMQAPDGLGQGQADDALDRGGRRRR